MTKQVVRFGVVGAGMIAAIHIDAIHRTTGAELVGVMDRGSGNGHKLAPHLEPRVYADLAEFIGRDDIDAVTVASPSGAHLEAALLAAQYKKHCLVEKPIEITVDRIDQMIAAHELAGTKLGGIFNTRYTEGAQLLAAAMRAGRFGRLTSVSAVTPWWRDNAYYDSSDWKGTWALDGGGAFMNQGIHSIDLLQWLVGEPVTSVNGRIATIAHNGIEVEDTGTAQLQFANGALGTVMCATSMWPGHFRTTTIAGTDGTAVLADGQLLFWQFMHETATDNDIRQRLLRLPGTGIGGSDPSAGVDSDGHAAVLQDFMGAIVEKQPLAVGGYEARKSVAIIRAVYESALADGAPVGVDSKGVPSPS